MGELTPLFVPKGEHIQFFRRTKLRTAGLQCNQQRGQLISWGINLPEGDAGHGFIPDKSTPDIDRESDAKTYTGVNCLDIIFKREIH
jgi:hypothetical protein